MKISDDGIIYCLENLAGYESDDIDCDDVEIAVNDDQFTTMSIVRTAELGAELARRLTEENAKLREFIEKQMPFLNSVSAQKAKQLLNQLKGQNNDK